MLFKHSPNHLWQKHIKQNKNAKNGNKKRKKIEICIAFLFQMVKNASKALLPA